MNGADTMQILVLLVMTLGMFGGGPMELVNTSGTLIGKIPAGSDAWIHNAAYVWLLPHVRPQPTRSAANLRTAKSPFGGE